MNGKTCEMERYVSNCSYKNTSTCDLKYICNHHEKGDKNKTMFTCFATDCTMPWLDCVCNSWVGYLNSFNLEWTMVLIYKSV